jgi:hypothetical protein
MARTAGLAVGGALALLLTVSRPVAAAEWGTLVPGESTAESVKARYGEPSKTAKARVEKYDTSEWTYEGERAPAGMIRMVVQFGVLKSAKYEPNVVRTFRLDPKPGVFTRRQIVIGWGFPDQGGTQDGVPVMVYKSGLTVYFDRDIVNVVSMWFTAPQPAPAKDK